MWFALFFFFKQRTAYELRISDWSSDVCSSDLGPVPPRAMLEIGERPPARQRGQAGFEPDRDGPGQRGRAVRADRDLDAAAWVAQIGRAPSRERVCQHGLTSVGAGASTNKSRTRALLILSCGR